METLEINTDKSYCIYLNPGSLAPLANVREFVNATEYVVVTETNVAFHCGKTLDNWLGALPPKRHSRLVLAPGESNKNFASINKILSFFQEFNLTRSGCVIAFGGGVIGDMVGFAASIWLRGVPVIQIPTTLLAMVDSSIGGKTGIDFNGAKNMVGAFHNPSAVICDTSFLHSLPGDFILDGLAEMLKAGIIGDSVLFRSLSESHGNTITEGMLKSSLLVKAGIVKIDPCEKNERKLLNLGHTVGHAIETLSQFSISHGKAVAMGIECISKAGAKNGITEINARDSIIKALENCNLSQPMPFSINELAACMKLDKKRTGDFITLVVPKKIGLCQMLNVPLDSLAEFLY